MNDFPKMCYKVMSGQYLPANDDFPEIIEIRPLQYIVNSNGKYWRNLKKFLSDSVADS